MLIPLKIQFKRLIYVQLMCLTIISLFAFANREYVFNLIGIHYLNQVSRFHELETDQLYVEKSNYYFTKALQVDSSFAPAWANLGTLTSFYLNDIEFENGQNRFCKAINLWPEKVELYLLRFEHVLSYFRLNASIGIERADSIIVFAQKLKPEDSEVLVHLAMYQANILGEYQQAILNLKKAAMSRRRFQFIPDLDRLLIFHHNLDLSDRLSELCGQVFFKREKNKDIPIPSKNHLGWIPRKDNFYIGIAKEYIKDDNYPDALKYLNLGLELNPDNVWALEKAATTYYLIGDYKNSIKMYEAAIQRTTEKRGFLYLDLGIVHKENHDYDKSIRAFRKAKGEGLPERIANYNIATIFALTGDKQQALQYLDWAIRDDASYRFYSKTDSSFIQLWNDEDFIVLTGSKNDF